MNRTQRGNLAWAIWFVALYVISVVREDPTWWRIVIGVFLVGNLLFFVYQEGETS